LFCAALQLGRMSTPDAPAQSLLFLSLYRIRFGKRTGGTLACLFLSVFFRPDNLPAVAGCLLLMRFFPASLPELPERPDFPGSRLTRVAFSSSLLACPALFAAINAWSEPRFWWFRPVPYPGVIDIPDPAPLGHFLRALMLGPLPLLLVLAALLFSLRWRASRQTAAFLIFLALSFPVRYLLFPHYEERFFVAFYLAGFLVIAEEFFRSEEVRPGSVART